MIPEILSQANFVSKYWSTGRFRENRKTSFDARNLARARLIPKSRLRVSFHESVDFRRHSLSSAPRDVYHCFARAFFKHEINDGLTLSSVYCAMKSVMRSINRKYSQPSWVSVDLNSKMSSALTGRVSTKDVDLSCSLSFYGNSNFSRIWVILSIRSWCCSNAAFC